MSRAEAIEIKSAAPELVEAAIVNLLDVAQNTIIMTTGLFPPFYNRPKVRSAVEKAANRVRSFNIILDNYVDVDRMRQELPWLFALASEPNRKITITRSESKIPHWMVIDGRHLRLEEPHSQAEGGRSNLIVKNADASEETKPSLAKVTSDLARFLAQSIPVS